MDTCESLFDNGYCLLSTYNERGQWQPCVDIPSYNNMDRRVALVFASRVNTNILNNKIDHNDSKIDSNASTIQIEVTN